MEATRLFKIVLVIYLCNVMLAEDPAEEGEKPPVRKNVKLKPKVVAPKMNKVVLNANVNKVDEDSPVWQKKLKAEEKATQDEDIEGAGDGPIEEEHEEEEGEEEEEDEGREEEEEVEEDVTEEEEENPKPETKAESLEEDSEEVADRAAIEAERKRSGTNNMIEVDEPLQPPKKVIKQVPSLVMINKFIFLDKLNSGKSFVVNIGSLGCDKCQIFYEDYRLVLHYLHDTKQKIDAYLITDRELLDDFQFVKDEYPAILYFRNGIPILYEGELTATSLQHWIAGHDKRATTELTDANFKQLVAVTEDKTTQWLVLFCNPLEPRCWRALALTETLASRIKTVKVGVVDISKNKFLSGKLKDPENFPSWFLFREHDMVQLMFYERLTLQHIEDVYKETSLTLSEKLGRAALQVRGVQMYTGAAVTVALLVFFVLIKKLTTPIPRIPHHIKTISVLH